jgi:hypothetical protein
MVKPRRPKLGFDGFRELQSLSFEPRDLGLEDLADRRRFRSLRRGLALDALGNVASAKKRADKDCEAE